MGTDQRHSILAEPIFSGPQFPNLYERETHYCPSHLHWERSVLSKYEWDKVHGAQVGYQVPCPAGWGSHGCLYPVCQMTVKSSPRTVTSE